MDRAVLVLVLWCCVLVSSAAGEEGCGGPLAANFPEGRSDIYIASGLAQSFHVKKTSRVTSFTSHFWTIHNGSVLESLAIHSDQASNPGPGPALTNATFHVASVPFVVSGERERRTFNSTRPEGILLTPGHYWLVAMLPGSMGWLCNTPAVQDPELPLTVLRGLAVAARPGSWVVHNQPDERVFTLGLNGCRAEEPTPFPPHKGGGDDGDAGTTVGIVLGVLAAIGLIGAAAVGLAVWVRKQSNH
ncbi:uncharacterized protein ACA1_334770, partial [Acanthamoeba castellanii str. Neff]